MINLILIIMNRIKFWFYRCSLKRRSTKPIVTIKQIYPSLISQYVKPLYPTGRTIYDL